MSKKHVAVCDQCGHEVPLGWKLDDGTIPAGWLMLAIVGPDPGLSNDRIDFCSWPCVASYASRRGESPDAH